MVWIRGTYEDKVLVWAWFFVKQKTAYEMRISDWSSDVCSSDLAAELRPEILHRHDEEGPVNEVPELPDEVASENGLKVVGERHLSSASAGPTPASLRRGVGCRRRSRLQPSVKMANC